MSGSFTFAIAAKSISILHIKALNKEGEKPANQTKIISAIILIIKVSFFLPIFFPANMAIPENIDKCIPDKARICDKPAFLKASARLFSVYSFAPERRAKSKPPALPQAYINLLNCKRARAR